ncbi:hypothetical protein BWI96_00660 [Siphonobacter sp. SORGH_AS_0500]|uniref:DUF3891 family protein n=1 Tax=Siphonobacter sp. SORGH_AS_0500 TaxID=1864824 RepID=UPI000CCA4B1B|nr:DUF3891 family protein [Siphonobacter sp. SORGH_AS_0500]PKK38585.1 hypothetical protein BWI96_00660 [Siphonobacter sp. SORGH_AS_0500]
MIVLPAPYGWEVIHQQAHGMLALQLAMQWKVNKRPVRWIETLVALTEHDDGQEPWEGRNHLTDAGAPLNFEMIQYSVPQCINVIQIGLEKSRWNALMTSMHISFLYEPKRTQSSELDQLLHEQTRLQEKWRNHYHVGKDEVTYAYAFLQWCDALSLILCQNQLPVDERRLEISKSPDGECSYVFQRKNGTIGVEPWPFQKQKFTVEIESYQVEKLTFTDDKDLFNTMQHSTVIDKSWEFRK